MNLYENKHLYRVRVRAKKINGIYKGYYVSDEAKKEREWTERYFEKFYKLIKEEQ